MKSQSHNILSILTAGIVLLMSASKPHAHNIADNGLFMMNSTKVLKAEALEVLQTKCNVCHKKKNPFMVFKAKNMEKRAEKINKMVFITGRMPKGDTSLTQREFNALKNWINSLNIN